MTIAELDSRRHFDDLRRTWQCRALIASQNKHVGVVLLSVLAHTFDDAMPVLLRVAFPGLTSISAPFLTTCGRIAKTGHIVADVAWKDGSIGKDVAIYNNEIELRDDFRRLADRLRLADRDRDEMFKCVQRWVVADRRLDPTMDPRDPDAKRLTVN
jgi:hypothetical protein